MALNPPLLASGLPLGLATEWFCLERDGLELRLDTHVPALGTQVLKRVRLYVTTLRLCVVADAPHAAGLRSLDIPLAGVSRESFAQPIFGCNYLEVAVAPVAGRGLDAAAAPPRARLYFLAGGAGTFLRVFFALMGRLRGAGAAGDAGDAAARAAFFAPPQMQQWVAAQTAFADPSDPSRLYLAQPAAREAPRAGAAAQEPPPAGYTYAAR